MAGWICRSRRAGRRRVWLKQFADQVRALEAPDTGSHRRLRQVAPTARALLRTRVCSGPGADRVESQANGVIAFTSMASGLRFWTRCRCHSLARRRHGYGRNTDRRLGVIQDCLQRDQRSRELVEEDPRHNGGGGQQPFHAGGARRAGMGGRRRFRFRRVNLGHDQFGICIHVFSIWMFVLPQYPARPGIVSTISNAAAADFCFPNCRLF